MSHGMEMDETNARKQEVLGSPAERALDFVVDLVRSREAYRDELIAQGAANEKLERERDQWCKRTESAEAAVREHMQAMDHQGMLIEWFRLLLVQAGMGFDGRKLTPGRQAKLMRQALNGEVWDKSRDPEDLDEAISEWMDREARSRGIDRENLG